MEEQAQNKQIGAIAVHSQYIKDLSLEIPHAPEIFSEIKSAPKIDVHVDVKSEPKGNNTYTSQLSISMNGKVEDKTLFVGADLCRLCRSQCSGRASGAGFDD